MWDVHQNALDVPSPKTMVPLLYSELGETVSDEGTSAG